MGEEPDDLAPKVGFDRNTLFIRRLRAVGRSDDDGHRVAALFVLDGQGRVIACRLPVNIPLHAAAFRHFDRKGHRRAVAVFLVPVGRIAADDP